MQSTSQNYSIHNDSEWFIGLYTPGTVTFCHYTTHRIITLYMDIIFSFFDIHPPVWTIYAGMLGQLCNILDVQRILNSNLIPALRSSF